MLDLDMELCMITIKNVHMNTWYVSCDTWWRHQMETFSALLAICGGNSPVPGDFPAQRPVARNFDVFFDLRLNKRLSRQIVRLVIWDAIASIMTSV